MHRTRAPLETVLLARVAEAGVKAVAFFKPTKARIGAWAEEVVAVRTCTRPVVAAMEEAILKDVKKEGKRERKRCDQVAA